VVGQNLSQAGRDYQNTTSNAGYNAAQARSSGYATQAGINNQLYSNIGRIGSDMWADYKANQG
jgi:hypothetical protein